jgi:hypothetical protein
MNIFDLTESPKMGRSADFRGIQSADDQSAASPIGSGTSERESKKKPVRMMGVAVKEDVDEGWFGDTPAATSEKWYLKKDGAVLRTVNGEPFTFKSKEDAIAWAKKTYKVSYDQQNILATSNPDKNLHREPRAQMEAGKKIKSNFKMPPESLQDKMYRQHQELRKQRGAPSPEEYKQRIAQKQKEIDDLKEGILDRAAPKMPKPRNPANAVLGNKVNAAGKHLDKKRRQELNPKHKHQDPLEEGWKDAVAGAALAGSIALGGMAHAGEPVVGQGQSKDMQLAVDMAKHNARVKYLKTIHGDNFQDKQMPDHRYGKLELKPNDKGGYIATVPLIVDNEVQESTGPLNWTIHFDDGTSQQVTVPSDEFDVRGYFAKRGKKVVKIDYSFAAQDRQDAPRRGTSDPAAHADSLAKAQSAYDRGLTEQAVEEEFRLGKKLGTRRDRFKSLRKRKDGILGEVGVSESQAVKITDYDTWSDEVKALGGEIHTQRDRNLLVAQSWDGEEIGKFHLGKNMGFINKSGDLDETIRKMGSQYRLLSKKGKNLGTFDSKAGAEKHEREVQYFKHKNMEEGVAEGKPENPSRRGFLKALAVAAVLSSTPVAKLMSDASSKMSIVKHRGKLGKYQGSDIDCTGYKIGKKQFYITVNGEPYTVQTGTGAGFMGQDFKNTDFKSDPYLQKIAPWLDTKDEYILQIADYDIELYDQNNQKIFPAKDQQQTKEMYSNGFIDAIIGYLDVYQTSAIQKMADVPSEPHYPEELPAIDKGSKGVSAIVSKAAGNDPIHIARLASLAKSGYDAITKKPDAQQSAPSFNAPAALPAPSDDNVLRPELNKRKEKSSVKRRGVDEDIERYVEALSRAGYEVTEEGVAEGWKGKLAGAVFAGLAALGGAGDADAQQVNLPGPKVSYIATVQAEVNGEVVTRSTNMGSNYKSEADVRQAVADYMESKGIIRYRINIDQKYDQPGLKRGDYATGGPSGNYGVGDYIMRYIDSQIPYPVDRNTRGGYATKESIEEDIERHLFLLSRAGYDIIQEEWSDKYKRSINCSNPKGFSQKAHCAGKKKNEEVSEEKVRLDPKCWTGKKIGNPKTKVKGGVRVNNCVPK